MKYTIVLRKSKVNRRSKKVKDNNKLFSFASHTCKGLKTSDGSFQECIKQVMFALYNLKKQDSSEK